MSIRKFFRKRNIIVLIIVVAIIVGFAAANQGKSGPQYDFVTAGRGNIAHEVSVTGSVKPAQSVDLAFETGGKVSQVLVKVGDKVKDGARLVALENGVLFAQSLQAQANLEAEQARLDEINKGTRPEEMQYAETAVQNAERVLADAQTNLANVQQKADTDIKSSYDGALTALQKSVSVGKTALMSLTDLQYQHFLGTSNDENRLTSAKSNALLLLLGASDAGRWSVEYIAPLTGGAFGKVQNAVNDPVNQTLIDQAAQSTASALQAVKTALDVAPITDNVTSTERTILSTEKTNIATEITVASGKGQIIAVQKMTNQNAVAVARESANAARNALLSAQDTLALRRAGSTPEQVAAQLAKVKSARANLQNYQAQIFKTILNSPINGVITKQDGKVGEIVAANAKLVSVISEADYEIEANIAEVDIADVKVGDLAKVTLDAYGSNDFFEAKVTAIDPAETVIEGVSTYKVTLQFISADARIRSGMTANIDILTDAKENVLIIPQRAVLRRNGDYVVRVLEGEIIKEVMVEPGLRGSDGNIGIVSGIKEGDQVVTFVKE